ncbi:MAG TPA: glycosyltransferase family 9 protein [Bacteroidota bacterium]|nr:glycosyltransferase family 9 protein [Bacteroidota bacterium]
MKKKSSASKKRTRIRIPECRNFTGYKPCFPGTQCYKECENNNPIGKKILIINLDAMGAVLQTTAMLPAIKRKYPQSHISWITLKNAIRLLENNPYIDAAYNWDPENWLILQNTEFDIVYSTDKSRRSCAFANSLKAKEKIGFGLNKDGVIVPLNKEAEYSYRLGLDDELKFHVNEKYGTEILQESMKLKFRRDEYVLNLSDEEKKYCEDYKKGAGITERDCVVGFNTGCSYLYPNKKMTLEQHVTLIERLAAIQGLKLVLLGGPEDTERNAEIRRRTGSVVISTPTTQGIRKGICYENICDVIVTGDSFGMHVAIALKKYVVAWFGLSCWSEIDLYERGGKLIPEGLQCAPCWKKACPYNLECIQMIDLDGIVQAVHTYAAQRVSHRKELNPA